MLYVYYIYVIYEENALGDLRERWSLRSKRKRAQPPDKLINCGDSITDVRALHRQTDRRTRLRPRKRGTNYCIFDTTF